MFVHYRSAEGPFFKVIDLKTGGEIPLVRWADDTLGSLERIAVDENGKTKISENGKEIELVREDRRIRLVDPRFESDA